MTDIDQAAPAVVEDWPEVAQLGGTGRAPRPPDTAAAGQRPALVAQSATEVGRPSPLFAGDEGTGHGEPVPDRPGALVCQARECRAEIRMARTEQNRDIPVDVDPVPDGNLVWRRNAAGGWRMHKLGKTEKPDPGERRFVSHFATCTAPEAFRRRKTEPDPGLSVAAATLQVAGLQPEQVDQGQRGQRTHLVRPPLPDNVVPITRAGQIRDGIAQLGRDREPATARYAGPVSFDEAPALDVLGAGVPAEDRTCPACSRQCPAVLARTVDGALVLLERLGGMYDHLVVRWGGAWQVRPVDPREQGLPWWNRAQAHTCRPHEANPDRALRCQSPHHGADPPAGVLSAGTVLCTPCETAREHPART